MQFVDNVLTAEGKKSATVNQVRALPVGIPSSFRIQSVELVPKQKRKKLKQLGQRSSLKVRGSEIE